MSEQKTKIKVGVMGSAEQTLLVNGKASLTTRAEGLADAIAARDLLLLTGATTGVVYLVGKRVHDAGAFHLGISPASHRDEHLNRFELPLDACDAIVYTGFGLKGRNVVLVRSCDIVLFIAGSMGSLNEFTIAHDEGKVIGCLTNTGGVADEASYLLQKFSKETGARVFENDDPEQLVDSCIDALHQD
ncbi:MAG TPA: hypothetical protein VJU86_03660 [Pyrinomonadaceae bacterium]|nr:hypothetical protein [Pyrinomonadaceae bacterium]